MPTQPTFTCATCDDQIAHHPVFHLGLAFCCAGCAADGPCMCSYDEAAGPAADVRTVFAGPAGVVPGAPLTVAAAAPGADPDRAAERRRAEERPLADVRR